MPIERDEIKSYTIPVSSINDVKLNLNIIVLKNELGEMRKHSRPRVVCFHKVSKLKSLEEHYFRLLQLYMPWRNENELKQDNQSYEDKYEEVEGDILCVCVCVCVCVCICIYMYMYKPYLDINYEELQNSVLEKIS